MKHDNDIREALHETDTRKAVYETGKSHRHAHLSSSVTIYEREPGSTGWQAVYSLAGQQDSRAFEAYTPCARATANAIGVAHGRHRAAAIAATLARLGGPLNYGNVVRPATRAG